MSWYIDGRGDIQVKKIIFSSVILHSWSSVDPGFSGVALSCVGGWFMQNAREQGEGGVESIRGYQNAAARFLMCKRIKKNMQNIQVAVYSVPPVFQAPDTLLPLLSLLLAINPCAAAKTLPVVSPHTYP